MFLCWPSPQAQVMFHFGQNINIVLVLYNINFMDAGRMVKCEFYFIIIFYLKAFDANIFIFIAVCLIKCF